MGVSINNIRILYMKYQEVKKLLGAVAIATTASLTACGTPAQPIESTLQAEPTQTVKEPTPTPTPTIETTATVTYEQSATESDELTIVNDEAVDYKVKDYEPPIYNKYMAELDYEYRYDEESDSVFFGEDLVSDNVDHKEDGTLWIRDAVIANSTPVVKYLRISDNDEVEAEYISLVPKDCGLISGITFVLTPGDDGVYKITDMLGVYEEDIKTLPIYEGTFTAYSKSIDGEEEIKVGDTIEVSTDLSLYPCFDIAEESTLANEDGTLDNDRIEEIEIGGTKYSVLRVIHINGTKVDKDGNVVATKKYALAGLDAKKDTVKTKDGKTVDKDKVTKQQTEDKDPSAKPEQQPAKKKESDAKPGQEKPASSAKENPTANDTIDRSKDEGGDFDPAAGAAEWGVPLVDPSALDSVPSCGITFSE